MVTAQLYDLVPGGTSDPAKSLRAIRAALVVRQDREAFDAGLQAVLDEVRVNLDLGVLNLSRLRDYPDCLGHLFWHGW